MLNLDYTARVVNLDARPDRWATVPQEMAKLGVNFERFPAVDPLNCPTANIGSTHSHTEALKGVSGLLFVFDDDVCFLDEDLSQSLFNHAYSELPEDWDMLYLGGNPKVEAVRFSDHLYKLSNGGVHCNTAILYQEKARDYISRVYDYRTNEIFHFDHWLFMIGQKEMNCFIMSPIIAWQKPGYSNARGNYQDYYMHIRSNEIRNLR